MQNPAETAILPITESSGNVYEDLGFRDAQAMLRKARLAAGIQEIIERNGWSQREAAKIVGISQPKLSNILKGRFNGISEMKLLLYLVNLGSDIRIIVSKPETTCEHGAISLEFA